MFMCRVCNEQCNDTDNVICDVCRNPVHVNKCAELSPAEMDCVRSKRRKVHFFCSKCDLINVISNLSREFEELKSEIAELRNIIIKTDRFREVGDNDNDHFTGDFVTPEVLEMDDRDHEIIKDLVYDRPEPEANTFNEPTVNEVSTDYETVQYDQSEDQSNIEVKSGAQKDIQNVKEEIIVEDEDASMEHLLPQKSKRSYRKAYNKFLDWRSKNNIQQITETVIINYINELAKTSQPASLWSYYSMLKSCLSLFENTYIGGFHRVKALLKEKTKVPRKTRSKFLSREQVLEFLYKASDKVYILEKAVLVMGIAGGCRTAELANIKLDDIDDRGSVLVVTLPDVITNKTRTFTVINEADMKPIDIYRKYLQLRPNHTRHRRLFVNYRDGKCTTQPVGLHKIGKMPSVIATFLCLPEPHLYTGHGFKRISSSLAVENGVSQRRARWGSNAVAESDVVDSIEEKIDTDENSFVKTECTCSSNCVSGSSGTAVRPEEGANPSTFALISAEEFASLRNVKLEPCPEEYNVVVEG